MTDKLVEEIKEKWDRMSDDVRVYDLVHKATGNKPLGDMSVIHERQLKKINKNAVKIIKLAIEAGEKRERDRIEELMKKGMILSDIQCEEKVKAVYQQALNDVENWLTYDGFGVCIITKADWTRFKNALKKAGVKG